MKLNPQILIVDDEPRMRDMLHRAVTSWGHKASTARSGEEALRLMQAEPANIILLDLNLPAMSGLEFLERLRQTHPTTEIIILTGFGDLEAAKKAIHLDVVEFLT
ncbi:MAG TPA: response regulator, partial [Tepidisphaeraceae bacterium]|nr:response regulator [Tepidisphaeraceae bacterium]